MAINSLCVSLIFSICFLKTNIPLISRYCYDSSCDMYITHFACTHCGTTRCFPGYHHSLGSVLRPAAPQGFLFVLCVSRAHTQSSKHELLYEKKRLICLLEERKSWTMKVKEHSGGDNTATNSAAGSVEQSMSKGCSCIIFSFGLHFPS